MMEKKLTDEELKQVIGGAQDCDELLADSNGTRVGVIEIGHDDHCHFNPSRWVKREGVSFVVLDCATCKYNEHPGWLISTCNADAE